MKRIGLDNDPAVLSTHYPSGVTGRRGDSASCRFSSSSLAMSQALPIPSLGLVHILTQGWIFQRGSWSPISLKLLWKSQLQCSCKACWSLWVCKTGLENACEQPSTENSWHVLWWPYLQTPQKQPFHAEFWHLWSWLKNGSENPHIWTVQNPGKFCFKFGSPRKQVIILSAGGTAVACPTWVVNEGLRGQSRYLAAPGLIRDEVQLGRGEGAIIKAGRWEKKGGSENLDQHKKRKVCCIVP